MKGLLVVSVALSLALLITGLVLRRFQGARGRTSGWIAPLIISGLPGALFGILWLIGPLYWARHLTHEPAGRRAARSELALKSEGNR